MGQPLNKVRGFEVISKYKDNENIKMPRRGTLYSAGYDFFALQDYTIEPNQVVYIETGIKAYMMQDEFIDLRVRSSLGIKRHLMMATGASVIDADYYNNPDNEGHIMVVLYNYGNETQHITAGEHIVQGIFTKYHLIDDDCVTTTRTGGTGSTN